MLTPYDEFPVHQASRPFSYIPSTDYNWDDGYFFGVFSPDDQLFLATGARINPNSDMIGGYALINVAGQQRTLRFNRAWRSNFGVEIGPWKAEFVEPLKRIRLTLADNDSKLSFDLMWEGSSPPVLEDHHVAINRGRRTTDQSRYSQAGHATGWIELDGKRWEVTPDRWSGSRDHSWGLYAERPPLSPLPSLLPPRDAASGPTRALRFWTCFRTDPVSGFFHLHETEDGRSVAMNDVFGTPFGGRLSLGWDGEQIELVSGTHEIVFETGRRLMKSATIHLVDTKGREWKQLFEVASPPWIVQTLGYHPGSWKDGGTFFTYHGSEQLATEWDDFDFADQPSPYAPYKVTGESAKTNFGEGVQGAGSVSGPEYLCKVTTWAPDGSVSTGAAQVEMFVSGTHHRYGERNKPAIPSGE